MNKLESLWINFILKRYKNSFGIAGYMLCTTLTALGLVNIFQQDFSDGIYMIGLSLLVFILNTERKYFYNTYINSNK